MYIHIYVCVWSAIYLFNSTPIKLKSYKCMGHLQKFKKSKIKPFEILLKKKSKLKNFLLDYSTLYFYYLFNLAVMLK